MRFITIITFCTFLIACGKGSADSERDAMQVTFGNTKLSIPKEYVLPGLPSAIVPDKGADSSGGASLSIPLVDLGLRPTSEEGLGSSIIVLVASSSGSESSAFARPDASSAWNATGLYKERIIEFDNEAKLYRVYPKAGHPLIWQYFRSSPESGGELGASWVSSCMAPPGSSGKDLTAVMCKTTSRYKTVESELTLSGVNIHIIDAINDGYSQLLRMWDSQP